MDEEGLLFDVFEEVCCMNRIIVLYCIFIIQNLIIVVMLGVRWKEIVKICCEYGLIVIEDEIYVVLMVECFIFFCYLLFEWGIFIGGMSKVVVVGLWVGYVYVFVFMVSCMVVVFCNLCWMVILLVFEIVS